MNMISGRETRIAKGDWPSIEQPNVFLGISFYTFYKKKNKINTFFGRCPFFWMVFFRRISTHIFH